MFKTHALLSQAVDLRPKDTRAHFLQGLLWQRQKAWRRAIENHERALACPPGPDGRVGLAREKIYLELANSRGGLNDMQDVARYVPNFDMPSSNNLRNVRVRIGVLVRQVLIQA